MANAFERRRRAANLTLTKIADMTGLSEGFLSRVATGQRRLGNKAREKIAAALRCSEADLIDDPAVALQNTQETGGEGGIVKPSQFFEATAKMLATFSVDDRVRLMQRAAEISEARPTEEATAQ
jgi:transcriptional regulator with XRE-family HTH domain